MELNSIKSKIQIAKIKASRDKVVGKYFLLIKSPSQNSQSVDYLLVVTKKIGKAVIRNHIKRRIKALLRKHLETINSNYDYSFIAKKAIVDCDFKMLEEEFLAEMRKVK